ncbi:MAG: N-acyl homoserine lactonase family protein, partial [Firmicutes bacterium]|nr:N-acyl homoserine lactonase family protein [Bacillota bacterium]
MDNNQKGLHVVPLCLGHIERDKSSVTYHFGSGQKISLPIIAYFIGGAEKKILIDTGTTAPEKTAPFHRPISQTPEETLTFNLNRLGLQPDDIDIVVNTHLHWDHCYNNRLFNKARFYVQREELRYAVAPLPIHVLGYESQNIGMRPPFIDCKYEVIEGDVEIVPGVSLIYTPGHTPGTQGVLVKTDNGKIFIAGDTIPLFENWEGPPGFNVRLPNTVHVDLEAYYRTF